MLLTNYPVDDSEQRKFKRPHDVGDGTTIAVSAFLLPASDDYGQVKHVDPWSEERSVDIATPGRLLIEARDADQHDDEIVAYCVARFEQDVLEIEFVDVKEEYRGNHIMEALVALAWRLTGIVPSEGSDSRFDHL